MIKKTYINRVEIYKKYNKICNPKFKQIKKVIVLANKGV